MAIFRRLVFAPFLFLLLAAPACVRAAGGETITFRKVFKSSYPEFTEIQVDASGAGIWDIRQLSDDPSPRPFQLGQPLVRRIFSLAEKLHDFQGIDLEMHRRIANLGQKTFVYQKGAETHQVSFNYTTDPTARELLIIFEGLAVQQTDLSDLQNAMRYDRLGVNDLLLRVEKDYSQNLYPEPAAFLSSLNQLAADEHFVDIARARARTLAGRIRSAP